MWYSVVMNDILFILLFIIVMIAGVGVPMFLIVCSIEKKYQQGLDIVEGIKEDGRKWDEESKKYWADWAERNKK